jgi:hypothetical protein
MAEQLDHYRADEDAPVAPGVYRVVGGDDDAVTLLRVGEDGRRVHSGVVARVAREDLSALDPADDPDAGLGRLRQAPGRLAERPLYAAMGLGLAAYGGYRFAAVGNRGGLLAAAGGLAVLWLLVR